MDYRHQVEDAHKRSAVTDVIETAKQEVATLSHMASKIEIAGSIRRGKKNPGDADIVLIPKNEQAKKQILAYAKRHASGNIGVGKSHLSYKTGGVEIEIYFADEKCWGAMLMYATGPNTYNVIMRQLAKHRNMKLNQYGLFKRDSDAKIAGETEEGIYEALGRNWKEPSRRGFMERR